MKTHRLLGVCLLVALLSFGATVHAQEPDIPPEWMKGFLRISGDRITFCVGPQPDWPLAKFEERVAEEIGAALLLDVEIMYPHYINALPVEWREVFRLLTDECDAFMGFLLIPNFYDDWMTFTRPYYETRSVFVTTNPAYRSLANVPRDLPLGSTAGSTPGDILLAHYLASLSSSERWRRFPYPTGKRLLEQLFEGVIAAGIMWEPELYQFTDGDPKSKGVHVMTSPIDNRLTLQYGIALLQRDRFMRTTLDQAIEALIEDGIIDEVIQETGVPGRAPRI